MAVTSSKWSRAASTGPEAFEYEEKLGAGVFGTVYKVKHKASGETMAMKILIKQRLESESIMKYAMTERNVMCVVKHPYIVPLHFAFQTETNFALVMQFCPNGNMAELLKKQRRLSTRLTRHYAAEVQLALQHLHEQKILYRDLKPENVVLDDDRHAMLTDFGLSKEQVTGPAHSFLGSTAYVAPEILERSGHDHTVDVYGLGVLVYNLLTGRPPFHERTQTKTWENIRRATLEIPEGISPHAAAFIAETMRRKPSERLGAVETRALQEHPFLAAVDFAALHRREVPVPSADDLPDAPDVTSSDARATQTSAERRREIFGRAKPCARVFQCAQRPKGTPGWDYAMGDSVVVADGDNSSPESRMLLGRRPAAAGVFVDALSNIKRAMCPQSQ